MRERCSFGRRGDAPRAAEDTELVRKANEAIAAADSVEKLEQIRRLVSERVREGKFHQDTADQLVKDILARVEAIGTEVEAVS